MLALSMSNWNKQLRRNIQNVGFRNMRYYAKCCEWAKKCEDNVMLVIILDVNEHEVSQY